MKLPGSLVLVWWPPVYRMTLPKHLVDERGVAFFLRRPEFGFTRGMLPGVIRWSLSVGYIEIRRIAS